mmetsp:Transcript_37223/g.48125  ORF Transcript_37223/g.48125 Transcript_37223/m.48125 type:complete len:167 (-) Transcript_37223:119-619(-)
MIMFRKFLFVFVILLATSPRLALTWCLIVNIGAVLTQYYYRPFNCFDCLLGRSRRCTHWGAMDQLEVCLLLAQTCFLSVGLYLLNSGDDEEQTPPTNPNDISIADIIMLSVMVCAVLLALCIVSYLYIKTYLLRNKMKHAGDKNEYQTAQNMQAVNTDAADFFCGC